MSQLYAQLASRPDPWLLGRTSAGLCTLQTACPLTVTYSGGAPAADTIAAGSAATVYGGSAATFDASADVWVVLTAPGSGALQVTKEADLATVVGDWAGLARVVQHSTEPYQPQAYLGAGGLGNQTGTTLSVLSDASALALDIGVGGTPPAGWETSGYDDSAWTAAYRTPEDAGSAWAYVPPGHLIWANPQITGAHRALFRLHIPLPAGTISGATLQVSCDQVVRALYVNGTAVGTVPFDAGPTPPYNVQTIDVRAQLAAAGPNLLALEGENDALGGDLGGNIAYVLSVTYAGAGTVLPDPGGSEGDLLYYHNGAWVALAPGTNGYELTLVAGDPAWTAQPASYTLPTASSSTLGGIKVGSGLSISAGVLAATGGGSVSSVALAGPTGTTVSGSPITGSGTLTLSWASQSANTVLAAPNGSSGAPTFRVLVAGDIPSLPASQITSGQLAAARGGTGLDGSAAANGALLIGNGSGYTLATLAAGSGVTVTNGSGTVTIAASGGSGTVTSIALTAPGFLSVSGSPITTSGTLAVTLATQSAATVFAGPASGSAAAPTFRALAASDLPAAAAAGGHIHAHGHFL